MATHTRHQLDATTQNLADLSKHVGDGRTVSPYVGMFAAGAALTIGARAVGMVRGRLRPKTRGSLHLKGVRQTIEVVRDTWGIPHISAENRLDMYFAQGFVHAQDRLWQMELNRRIGAGRLSEIIGAATLDLDRLMRRISLRQAAIENYKAMRDDPLREALEAYCAGVNAYIETQPLPLEFLVLRYRPEAWSPVDSLQWSKMMGWSLSTNWEAELLRARLVATLGAEQAAKLESFYDEGQPLIIPSDSAGAGANADAILRAYNSIRELSGIGFFGNGSDSWVVDGTRTVTGKPLFANDPHLRMGLPGIWYLMHSTAPGYDVSGATLPGAPLVVIGHNTHAAWGITSAMADVQDLFVEQVNPDNSDQYKYRGQWRNFTVRRDYIGIKGQPDEVEIVRSSIHGPVLTAFDSPPPTGQTLGYDTEGRHALSVAWSGYAPGKDLTALDRLNRAASWDDFHAALADWTTPALNFTYADTSGTIGYQLAGRYPRRAGTDTNVLLPKPGWTGRDDWQGTLDYETLPFVVNPDSHYIITANNKIVGDDYPHHLSREYMPGWRAARIAQLLATKEKLTADDFARMQADVYTQPGVQLAKILVERLTGTNSREQHALDYLRTWDGRLTTDSVAGTIYEATITHLLRQVLAPVAGDLIDVYLGKSAQVLSPVTAFLGRAIPMLLRHIEADDTTLLHWGGADATRTWADALRAALLAALTDLETLLGADMAGWRWGRMHKIPFEHPLGAVKPLNRIFNRPSAEAPGDPETLFPGAFVQSSGGMFDAVGWTSSYRVVVDLADIDHARHIAPAGQSGWPFSPHYFDAAADWLAVRYRPMLMRRSDIAAAHEATLVLRPSDS